MQNYAYLVKEYESWTSHIPEIDLNQSEWKAVREMCKHLCFNGLKYRKTALEDMEQKDIITYDKALIELIKAMSKIQSDNGDIYVKSLGERIAEMEDVRPAPDIIPEIEDIDNIGTAFRILLGHISETVQIPNAFKSEYDGFLNLHGVNAETGQDLNSDIFRNLFGDKE